MMPIELCRQLCVMQSQAVCCAGVQYKLPLKNVGGFGLSPAADTSMLKLAAWVPEGKGAPGFVGIWDVTSLGKSQDAPAPIARRSFFRVGFMPLGLSSCSKALPLASMCSSETAAKLPRELKCTMRNIAELRSYVCVCDVLKWLNYTVLQANSVRLYWNSTGTALLAITAADVDVTNQSYYGEQKIHYLAADGTNDCLVPNLKV